jgi:hypothetical protein
MTTQNFACSSGDGQVNGESSSYSTARGTAVDYDSTGTTYYVGQTYTGGIYLVYRAFLKFDTSSIPDDAIIDQINLKLVATTDNSTTDFNVIIKKFNWASYDPVSAGNMESVFDGILSATADDNIWRSTSGISTNTQYSSGNLNINWINKTGYTYYGLISSRDISGTQPTGSENVRLASQENATSAYRPILTIEYHEPSSWIPQIIIF